VALHAQWHRRLPGAVRGVEGQAQL